MNKIRIEEKSKRVQITCYIDKYLVELARKESLNISDFLRRELKERLGIKEYDAF